MLAGRPSLLPRAGFRVANDHFWDYFARRGGVCTLGYPASRELTLMGFRVQFFQRTVMQSWADGSVRLLNLLDDWLLHFLEANAWYTACARPTVPRGAAEVPVSNRLGGDCTGGLLFVLAGADVGHSCARWMKSGP
jgi:hypothetical protein